MVVVVVAVGGVVVVVVVVVDVVVVVVAVVVVVLDTARWTRGGWGSSSRHCALDSGRLGSGWWRVRWNWNDRD